jgi:hypothetical protein
MKQFFTAAILVCALSTLALSTELNTQDAKPATPNFTGTWKLNLAKSDFGRTPAPESLVDKIEHKDAAITLNSTRVEQGATDAITLNLTTDGKENTNKVHGAEVKTKLKWEGAALLLDSAITLEGGSVSLKDKWTLSADGKTLTITRHYSGPEGEADVTYLLEKQ